MLGAMNNKRRRSLSEPITSRLSEGRVSGNYRPFVGGQAVTNWPERGAGGSGHKRTAGILGFQRPRYASGLRGCLSFRSWCRWRGSNPHTLTGTRF